METRRTALCTLLAAVIPVLAPAQTSLTLTDAVERARTATPSARALAASRRAADARVARARANFLPRLDVVQDVRRGNDPLFVFGSLLAQRRVGAENLAIESLNTPGAITNLRSAVSIEQTLFDRRNTSLAVQAAGLERDIVAASADEAGQDLALAAAQWFVALLQAEAAIRAATAAQEAAESDLTRTRSRRDAGLVTDADALAMEVHLASMRERVLTAQGDLTVAQIRLNEAIGAPLDAVFALVPPNAGQESQSVDQSVTEALQRRASRRAAEGRIALASSAVSAARAAWLPRIVAQGGWDFNGSHPADLRGSWMLGAQVQLNVFRGFGDRAQVAEARQAHLGAVAEGAALDRAIEVEVRAATARLEAARAREVTGAAALAQAQESQRIVRDRYDSGLATVVDVLRAAEAVQEAESRAIAARMDVVLQRVVLDRATGRLEP